MPPLLITFSALVTSSRSKILLIWAMATRMMSLLALRPIEVGRVVEAAAVLAASVTRLGDFQMLMATNFQIKATQIFSYYWGYFEKRRFYVVTDVSTFWVTFGNVWATLSIF